MAKPRQKGQKQNPLLAIVNFVLLELIVLWLLFETRPVLRPFWLTPFILFAVMYLANILTVVLHEGGHLVAGMAVGMKFMYMIVRPIVAVVRHQRRIHVRWGKVPGFTAGGLAALHPLKVDHLPRKLAIMVLGGPLANLEQGCVFGVLYLLTPPDQSWLRFAFGVTAAMGFFTGTMNLLPFRAGAMNSDGKVLLNLLFSNDAATYRMMALHTLVAAARRGDRPRDWNGALIQQVLRLNDKTNYEVAGHLLAYYHYLDRGEIAAAGEHLDTVMGLRDHYPQFGQETLYLEAAYFEGVHRGDAQKAAEWINPPCKGLITDPWTRRRAQAAVALARGDWEVACRFSAGGLASIVDPDEPGTAAAEADWLREIQRRAESALMLQIAEPAALSA